jgi:hypothetical protein
MVSSSACVSNCSVFNISVKNRVEKSVDTAVSARKTAYSELFALEEGRMLKLYEFFFMIGDSERWNCFRIARENKISSQ